MSDNPRETHLNYLRECLQLAKKSPPKPTNFCVGCVIVSYTRPNEPQILSTGYTLELPGNTHAEQCALNKLAEHPDRRGRDSSTLFSPDEKVVLYTSLEPCGKRSPGNLPCVQRIIQCGRGVDKVIFGAKEPEIFVSDSQSCRLMTQAGVDWEYIPDLEEDILAVAKAGHVQHTDSEKVDTREQLVDRGDIPPNPKKRMMEI